MASPGKIGFLLSAGGAAFCETVRRSGWDGHRFHVVCDRDCGAQRKAAQFGISSDIIDAPTKDALSVQAAKAFKAAGCDLVITHFSRLVSAALYDEILTLNVHPALLPAFVGMDGVEQAHWAAVPLQGASLHVVDAGIDTGQIVAQTAFAVPGNATLDWRNALSFRQKTIVTLVALDWIDHGLVDVTKRGAEAFDTARLPAGDTICAPGFAGEGLRHAAEALLADLPPPTI
ncbi:MAG: formyltransferase family protein [Roseobacter sp.]